MGDSKSNSATCNMGIKYDSFADKDYVDHNVWRFALLTFFSYHIRKKNTKMGVDNFGYLPNCLRCSINVCIG